MFPESRPSSEIPNIWAWQVCDPKHRQKHRGKYSGAQARWQIFSIQEVFAKATAKVNNDLAKSRWQNTTAAVESGSHTARHQEPDEDTHSGKPGSGTRNSSQRDWTIILTLHHPTKLHNSDDLKSDATTVTSRVKTYVFETRKSELGCCPIITFKHEKFYKNTVTLDR